MVQESHGSPKLEAMKVNYDRVKEALTGLPSETLEGTRIPELLEEIDVLVDQASIYDSAGLTRDATDTVFSIQEKNRELKGELDNLRGKPPDIG